MIWSLNINSLYLTLQILVKHLYLPSRSPLTSVQTSANLSSDVQFYLTVYASIAAANTVFTALRAFLFAYGAICAATAIHNRLLDRVLKVRLLSFEPPSNCRCSAEPSRAD